MTSDAVSLDSASHESVSGAAATDFATNPGAIPARSAGPSPPPAAEPPLSSEGAASRADRKPEAADSHFALETRGDHGVDLGGEAVGHSGVARGTWSSSESLRSAHMNGLTKAAVFILSLDEEAASRVLRCLSDEELSLVTAEIARIGVIDKETVAAVMGQFLEIREASGIASEGGLDPASRLLQNSLPEDRASQLTELLAVSHDRGRFAFLSDVDAPSLVACLEEERHQTIAAVLAQMNPARAADVLERLPADQRKQVIRRIASLDGASEECILLIEQVLRKHFEGACFSSVEGGGGVKAVAQILRAAEEQGGSSLFDDLREERPELAEKVSRYLFDFKDLARFDDGFLAQALKTVHTRELALALKNTDNKLLSKVMRNLSRRSAERLRASRASLGPVRLSEVAAARRFVLERIISLDEGVRPFSSTPKRENRGN